MSEMINVDMTPNKSKKYLLPLLSEFIYIDNEIMDNLINTYIFDKKQEYKNCIFLLFKYAIKNPKFSIFEHKISKIEGYKATYDLENNMVLYVVKFPKEYMSEYNHFKNGKYSEYDDDAQEIIKNFLIDQGVSNNFIKKIKDIFNKSETLKKQIEKDLNVTLPANSELEDIMEPNKETIDINKYINKYI